MSFFISKELEGIVTKEMLYDKDDVDRVTITNMTKESIKKFDFLEFQPQKNKLKLSCRNISLKNVMSFLNKNDDYEVSLFSKKNKKQKILINKIKSKQDEIILNLTLL